MAILNPSPQPTQDPNYLNYSRSVEAPSPNMSGKIGLETAGQGISDVAAAADFDIKEKIKTDTYKKVDKYRDEFTEGLQGVKATLDQGVVPQAIQAVGGKVAGNTSLLDANASADEPEELPVGLQSGISRIQQLAQAKASGSIKLNDTKYSSDVLDLAKQLRSQYGTGYRDYIDQEVSKASGLPVANSYYQNLMLDINRQMNQMAKVKDDTGTLMKSNMDVPNMGVYMNQRAAGDPKYPGDAAITEKIANWQHLKSNIAVDAAKRAESKEDDATKITTETRNLTRNVNNLVSHHVEDNLALSGMSSLRDLLTYFDDAQAGRRQATDAEIQQRSAQLSVYRNYIYKQAHSIGIEPGNTIGNDVAEKIITTAMSPIDTYIKFANDKETGPAYYHLRQNQAIVEDDKNNWLMSKDKGAIARQFLASRYFLGEQYFPDYLRAMMTAGQDKPFAAALSQEGLAAVHPYYDERGTPIPRYQVDAIQHGKKVGIQDPEYYGSITALPAHIADPKMNEQTRDQMIDWTFNPKNIGVLNELKMEYRDPKTNEIIPGKYRAFNVMLSPGVIDAVSQNAKSKPENYEKMKNWGESEFGSLYRQDLQTLNQVLSKPSTNPRYQGLHFGYDDTTSQFDLRDRAGNVIKTNPNAVGVQYPDQVYVNGINDVLTRVNSGIQRLRYLEQHDPTGEKDVHKVLLQTLQTAGFRPGENITNATEGMAKAIIHARKPDLTPEQVNELLLK